MLGKVKKGIMEVVAVFISLIVLIPVFMLVINSFKSSAEASELKLTIPGQWHVLENYKEVFIQADVIRVLINSLLVTCVSVMFVVVLSAMASFVLQRKNSRLSNFIYSTFIIGLFFPAFMVQIYFLVKLLHMNKSLIGPIFVYIALNIPTIIFMFYGYFKSIPRQIDESAILDGCGIIRLFFKIIFPLSLPITITAVIISFMSIWNDFNVALYFLSVPERRTLPMTTFFFFSQKKSDWNLVLANVVIVSLPVILLYFALQRYIIDGMATGAIKG